MGGRWSTFSCGGDWKRDKVQSGGWWQSLGQRGLVDALLGTGHGMDAPRQDVDKAWHWKTVSKSGGRDCPECSSASGAAEANHPYQGLMAPGPTTSPSYDLLTQSPPPNLFPPRPPRIIIRGRHQVPEPSFNQASSTFPSSGFRQSRVRDCTYSLKQKETKRHINCNFILDVSKYSMPSR